MSVHSKPFYWLVCDEPGCERKSTEGHEFDAWADEDNALESAECRDWLIIGDEHYCYEHGDAQNPQDEEVDA